MSAILKALQNRKPVELKSEKVELGLVDDLAKQTTELKSVIKDFDVSGKATEKAFEAIKTLQKQEKELDKKLASARKILIKTEAREKKIASKVDKLYGQLEKASGTLGVKLQDIKGFKAWDEADKALYKIGTKYVSANYYKKD